MKNINLKIQGPNKNTLKHYDLIAFDWIFKNKVNLSNWQLVKTFVLN